MQAAVHGLRRFPAPQRARRRSAVYRPSVEGLEERCLLSNTYVQTNLVSDIAGVARFTDPNLVNPWGIAYGPGPFWISDNNAGVSTLYSGVGRAQSLVVSIPPPHGSPPGAAGTPTGTVFNGGTGFMVKQGGTSGPSIFIFATEDGTIAGWSPGVNATHAVIAVDHSTVPTAADGAVFKGLTLGTNSTGTFLYAADFRHGTVDVFDQTFHAATLKGHFVDSTIPMGFAPFDIQNIGGQLFVTYAKQNALKHDDVGGPGNGFVDVFNTDGVKLRRFATRGVLDSPWGLAQAPANFGKFSNDILIGNFRDGRINAFDPKTGGFLGPLVNQFGDVIAINRLWALTFGNGGQAGNKNSLFFTAGIADESHGLFGQIDANPAPAASLADISVAITGVGNLSRHDPGVSDAVLPSSTGSDNARIFRRQFDLAGDAQSSLSATRTMDPTETFIGSGRGHGAHRAPIAGILGALDAFFASDFGF